MWAQQLTYETEGGTGTWLEQRCDPSHPWGLGCKVCRWAGLAGPFAQTAVRCERGTRLSSLLRHGNHLARQTGQLPARRVKINRAHEQARSIFPPPLSLASCRAEALSRLAETEAAEPQEQATAERQDAPAFALLHPPM